MKRAATDCTGADENHDSTPLDPSSLVRCMLSLDALYIVGGEAFSVLPRIVELQGHARLAIFDARQVLFGPITNHQMSFEKSGLIMLRSSDFLVSFSVFVCHNISV